MKFFKYHPLGMNKVIADLVQIIKPNINIFEANNYLTIGKDVLTVDIVASFIIGISPNNVKHLKIIATDRNLDFPEITDVLKEKIKEYLVNH